VVLTFAHRNDVVNDAMVNEKKHVMPKMDLEGAPPEVVQLFALVAALTDQTNAAREQIASLEAEVTRLKEARKPGVRTRK
jgi:hypothetical protein